MAKEQQGTQAAQMGELLSRLEPVAIEKEKLSPQLEDIPLENQLLKMADVTLEQETGVLHDVLKTMGKL
ncbi:MAG TPA: hypothetical protein PLU41_05130 [Acidobacteriota bacterium]|jgi:hypothetical protein|nr:hypothetical protein [Acidobacteriota bacterium]HNU01800.1 hypothetical protein [Acidobacteriota bacterium]HQO25888.1 hypothetical protein [Acidobacteriota bacterium]HQP73390.1 hypothetical protein [Acidobacteriota bacterium]